MSEGFAARLRTFRRRAGMTQDQLAQAAGLSVDGVGFIERGYRRRPRPDTVELLINALGLTEDEAAELRALSRPNQQTGKLQAPSQTLPPPSPESPSVPRQLPCPPTTYVGRDCAVADLVQLLTAEECSGQPRVASITGMGGVGKTSLALLVAHRAAEHFPDGQLYLNLRANGATEPLSLHAALTYLLTSLGVQSDGVPADPLQAAALYRTKTSNTRLLVVLDNVGHAQQVEALLPGASGNAVLLTSRSSLGVAIDAEPFPLEPLPADAAKELLASIVGEPRVDSDPTASRDVINSCAGLPLALRIVAARMQARPQWAMSDVARRLSDRDSRLAELESCGVAVSATLSDSVAQLKASTDPIDQDAASAWLAMGHLPVTLVPPTAIAAACRWSATRTRLALERLLEVSLIEEPLPGALRMHDLIHALARREVQQLTTEDQRRGQRRVLDHYVALAWRSLALCRDTPAGFDERALTAGVDPTLSPTECLAVIAHEAEQVIALASYAPRDDREQVLQTTHLTLGLMAYFVTRVNSAGWCELLTLVLRDVPDDALDVRIWLHQDIAFAHTGRGEHEPALAHARTAVDLARSAARPVAEASAQNVVAITLRRLGRMPEAIAACRRGLELCEQTGNQRALAIAWRDMGQLQSQNGDLDHGITSELKSLELYRRIDVRRGVAMTLINVGVMYRKRGDFEASFTHLTQAIEVSRSVGDLALETEARYELGCWHLAAGDPASGITAMKDSLAELDSGSPGRWELRIRRRLGLTLDTVGRHDEAHAQWLSVIRLHEQRGEVEQAHETRRLRLRAADHSQHTTPAT